MRKHDYFLRVAHSLAACQVVELELKLYITQAFELVKKAIAGRMPFEMKGADYKDASLERLIEIFKKLSANPSLVTKLTKFKNERNFVAHKAIAACLDADGELDESAASDLQPRIDDVAKAAERLTEEIQREGTKIIIHLYLDLDGTNR